MPDCGYAEPEPPYGGEAYTVCYATLDVPKCVIKDIDARLRKAPFFYVRNDDGVLRQISGAVMGNKVDAWRTERRIDRQMNAVEWDVRKTLFLTLTARYKKTEKGRIESWETYRVELPKYLRKLKKCGMTDYFAVKEAFADGGCHAHILCQFEGDADAPSLLEKLHNYWSGNVVIEPMRNLQVVSYLRKHLDRNSHVEYALLRAKRQWNEQGDEQYKAEDCKKLWTNYYCSKLGIRRYSVSLSARSSYSYNLIKDKQESVVCLETFGANIDRLKPKKGRCWLVPWEIKRRADFEPRNCVLQPVQFAMAMKYIRTLEREKDESPEP